MVGWLIIINFKEFEREKSWNAIKELRKPKKTSVMKAGVQVDIRT
jgi:hypothetical protein